MSPSGDSSRTCRRALSELDTRGGALAAAVAFLERLGARPPLPTALIGRMADLYGPPHARNSELRLHWQLLALKGLSAPVVPDVVAFVTEQGRMKYVRPLYRYDAPLCSGGADPSNGLAAH